MYALSCFIVWCYVIFILSDLLVLRLRCAQSCLQARRLVSTVLTPILTTGVLVTVNKNVELCKWRMWIVEARCTHNAVALLDKNSMFKQTLHLNFSNICIFFSSCDKSQFTALLLKIDRFYTLCYSLSAFTTHLYNRHLIGNYHASVVIIVFT